MHVRNVPRRVQAARQVRSFKERSRPLQLQEQIRQARRRGVPHKVRHVRRDGLRRDGVDPLRRVGPRPPLGLRNGSGSQREASPSRRHDLRVPSFQRRRRRRHLQDLHGPHGRLDDLRRQRRLGPPRLRKARRKARALPSFSRPRRRSSSWRRRTGRRRRQSKKRIRRERAVGRRRAEVLWFRRRGPHGVGDVPRRGEGAGDLAGGDGELRAVPVLRRGVLPGGIRRPLRGTADDPQDGARDGPGHLDEPEPRRRPGPGRLRHGTRLRHLRGVRLARRRHLAHERHLGI
mmetsp:Transcript_32273/g.102912  ORF Transcript_32273/g.102912 Transcript_32273/m.102912 type:complete len:289 (-) Transcript_32273:226-1092(-)